MGELPEGGAAAESKSMILHSTSSAELNPLEIGTSNWAAAERAVLEIIRKVQPNSVSEERRKMVVDYIQRLIRTCLGVEVLAYGSVPLKTYLPEGDIDLTTFGSNVEDTFADDIRSILEEEEKNASPEFVVKDVQLVRAEVKLVKCIVEDIVVDVSFNQVGGISTLCFLEQADRLIGRDHLFKRSIILIKAWCYYESRILGAHHGLISTYALEIMVLYIIHLFHSKLDGPFAVMYKFLDYFSKFDWATHCITLNGPVRVSSLPDIDVEMPEDRDQELLLQSDFLSLCATTFAVPYSGGGNNNSRRFQLKHLNIFDPLKETNNLGRSVSRGNFYRICSAFSYGARKLARVISQPVDSISKDLHLFFLNTVGRHGGGYSSEVDVFDISSRDLHPKSTESSSQNSPTEIERSPNANRSVRAGDFPYYAPHLYFLKRENKEDESGGNYEKNVSPPEYVEGRATTCNEGSSNWAEPEMAGPLSPFSFSGDYEGYMQCLNYSKWCCEQGVGVKRSLPLHPSSGPLQNNGPHFNPTGFSLRHHPNGLHRGTARHSMQPLMLPGVAFGWEEVPKTRGTGTYFPNTNHLPQDYRSPPPAMKGRNQYQLPQGYRPPVHNNGPNMLERGIQEASKYSPHPNTNNYLLIQPEGRVGDHDLLEDSGNTVPEKRLGQKLIPSSPIALSRVQNLQSMLSREQERILLGTSYHLKDDKDFPPLPA